MEKVDGEAVGHFRQRALALASQMRFDPFLANEAAKGCPPWSRSLFVTHRLVSCEALGRSQGHRDGVLISLKTSAGVRCSW